MFVEHKAIIINDKVPSLMPGRDGVYCRGCGRKLSDNGQWLPCGTIIDKCSICLKEGLPREAIYIDSEGLDRLAYHKYDDDMVAVWSKAPMGKWFEWWDLDFEAFAKEFGIDLNPKWTEDQYKQLNQLDRGM
jgi:hypothetical protein